MDLRRYTTILLRLLVSRNYRFLRRKKVFDPGYYRENCAGSDGGADPLWHYVKLSGNSYTDLLETGRWRQQADPHPLFDTGWYLLRYFPGGLDHNPLVHYLRQGWRRGFWPGPFLDPKTYAARSMYQPSLGDPLSHYTHTGALAGVSPSPYFDVDYYLDKNPVLREVKSEIIKHYKLYGSRNLKSPIPLFDPAYYLSQLDDPGPAGMDPLSSYLAMADSQECQPSLLFEPDHYAATAQGPPDSKDAALAHYLEDGVYRGETTCRQASELSSGPLISVLVPVYNPDIGFLNNCIRSVLYQAYPRWELCLADDCSPNPEVRTVLTDWSERDARIKVVYRAANGGISAATNSAAELATGTYVGFLDNDDELSPDCLLHVAEKIVETGAPVLYSDEDLIGNDGSWFSTFHKPDFNLGLLFTHNYITHFVTVAKELFDQVGGFDSTCDGAQDFDLMLRLTEHTEDVLHIPRVLYHWRASETSTSINHEQKSYAHEAGKKGLAGTIARRGIQGEVVDSGTNFFYRLTYDLTREPQVAILAPSSRANRDRLEALLRASTSYPHVEIQVILPVTAPTPSDGSENALQQESGEPPQGDDRGDRSLAAQLHHHVKASSAEFILFLTVEPIGFSQEWLEELLLPALHHPDIGVVCGRVDTDGEGKESYRLPELSDVTTEYFASFLSKCTRHMNWLHCGQYVSFCDWDICLIKRSLYEEIGGFDSEAFPNRLAMLDLSLRAAEHGLRTLYTPYSMVHVASPEEGRQRSHTTELQREKARFQRKWKTRLLEFDRYFNLGILDENGIDRGAFYRWLCGAEGERKG